MSFGIIKRTQKLFIVLFGLATIQILSPFSINPKPKLIEAADVAVRGVAGDLWADKQFGKRDFKELSPRKVVPDKVFSPGGVIVDRSVSPGRAYVWDSGNSRILGIDLADCYNKDSSERCSTSIVIGQPSATDYGACNQDASFQFSPNRVQASASTLCGIPEWTHTTLEEKSFTSMFVDLNGDLYVADVFNHRVLKFISPFTTDTIADEVWGQADFSGNLCNRGGGWQQATAQPSANTLCFVSNVAWGSGVALDSTGNLWVADGGNNRILRFTNNSGAISKTADLVIGRTNFTTGGDTIGGSTLNRLKEPKAIGFDNTGRLYVADAGNNRVIRYTPPFLNNMSGTVIVDASDLQGANVESIQFTPDKNQFFTYETLDWDAYFHLWDLNGVSQVNRFSNWNPGGGSMGIDTEGNVLISAYVSGNDVLRYSYDSDLDTYVYNKSFYYPPGGYNLTSEDRFEQGGWGGLGVLSNGQMIATDGRLMYWNDPLNTPDGSAPDGFMGGDPLNINLGYSILTVDQQDRIYVQRGGQSIEIYQGPITSSATPITTLTAPFNALGGGTVHIQNQPGGLAVSDNGEFLWISDTDMNRVFRIRDPLTTPIVDIIIGQTNLSGGSCNQGVVLPPNQDSSSHAPLNMLCIPGALKLDKFGNLYISDHFFEVSGNWRVLMFAANTFPDEPSTILFNPTATKEFPRYGVNGSTIAHGGFEPAFNSANRMVIGINPYLGSRYLQYYNNPEEYNPLDPSDPDFATPDGYLNDFNGWVFAITFDQNDNLYAFDTNRGRINIYLQPFGPVSPPTVTNVTAIPSPNSDSTPNYTFHTTNSGTILYGGACSSATTTAVSGNNTITLNHLSDGTYSNCTIRVRDNQNYTSNTLTIPTFTINARSAMLKSKGDFNLSGRVDLSDLSILASYWNQNSTAADANGDGKVNLSDLSILAQNWLQSF